MQKTAQHNTKIWRLVQGQNEQHTPHYRQGRTSTLCVVDTVWLMNRFKITIVFVYNKQKMTCKTSHIKLTIEQHEPHYSRGELGHWGMTWCGYDRVTVVKNTVIRHTWRNDQINSHKYIGLNILYGMHEGSLNINPIYWRKSDMNSETKIT